MKNATWSEVVTAERKIDGAIEEIQAGTKVWKIRTLHLLAEDDKSPTSKPLNYPTHFKCKLDEEKKKEINFQSIKKGLPNRFEWNQ